MNVQFWFFLDHQKSFFKLTYPSEKLRDYLCAWFFWNLGSLGNLLKSGIFINFLLQAHLTRRLILDTSADSEKEENMVEWLREVFIFLFCGNFRDHENLNQLLFGVIFIIISVECFKNWLKIIRWQAILTI